MCCLCSFCLRPIVCLFVLLCLIYPSVSNLLFATRHFSPPLLFVQLFTVSPTWGTEALHYNTIHYRSELNIKPNSTGATLQYNRSKQNTEPISTGATIQYNRSKRNTKLKSKDGVVRTSATQQSPTKFLLHY